MISKVIEKSDLQKLLRNLCTKNLYAPVEDREGKINFELVKDPKEVILEFANTLKPAKSLFLPQTEIIFEAGEEEIRARGIREGGVIFGLRPCDAKSVQLLRKVFEKDYKDPYFLQREENFLKIGLACTTPGENCFCTSLGLGPFSNEGLNLLLTNIGERYYVEALNERGEKLVEENPKVFSEPAEADVKSRQRAQANAEKKITQEINVEQVSEKLGEIYDSTLWDEVSEICIGCGICTYLCPTCYCFDLTDEEVEGKILRVRTWDTCMSSYFTLQSSGYNPRPARRERLRNRVYHKFNYLLENLGELGCVGCGRCLENCPVEVDLIEILSGVAKS